LSFGMNSPQSQIVNHKVAELFGASVSERPTLASMKGGNSVVDTLAKITLGWF
jgi:hypothetical protein